MLAALVGLYIVSGQGGHAGTFDFRTLTDLTISNGIQKALFLGFFAAFAIKAPMWPVHTWLPDAAAESTPGTAVIDSELPPCVSPVRRRGRSTRGATRPVGEP